MSHFPGDCLTELSDGKSLTLKLSTVAGVFLALVTKARKFDDDIFITWLSLILKRILETKTGWRKKKSAENLSDSVNKNWTFWPWPGRIWILHTLLSAVDWNAFYFLLFHKMSEAFWRPHLDLMAMQRAKERPTNPMTQSRFSLKRNIWEKTTQPFPCLRQGNFFQQNHSTTILLDFSTN